MAPKRGGSSSSSSSSGSGSSSTSSSGSSINTCPGAFSAVYSAPIVFFASYCLFFVLTLAVLISLCCVRKRHGNAKKLAGPIYMLSLLCMLIGYALMIIATMLRECRTTSVLSFYDWAIAYTVFFRLGTYLLLVVVVWGVNTLLRKRLGSDHTIFKLLLLGILGVMGALTCGYLGLGSWNLWTSTQAGRAARAGRKTYEQQRLALTYYILYLLSVVAGATISGVTLLSMRSRQIRIGNLLGWIVVLTAAMLVWISLSLVSIGSTLRSDSISLIAQEVFEYLENFFQTLSFVAILFLAKSNVWDEKPAGHSTYPQEPMQPGPFTPQQYAFNNKPGQTYYYHQQPAYIGQPPTNNGHST